MGGATPHGGVEPGVGPKTVVVGFPRVVVECLLALAELARGEAAAVEGMDVLNRGVFHFPLCLFFFTRPALISPGVTTAIAALV